MPIPVGRARSVAALAALSPGDEIAVGVQIDPTVDRPGLSDLHRIATRARIVKISRRDDGRLVVVLEGLSRMRLEQLETVEPTMRVSVFDLNEGPPSLATRALAEELGEYTKELAKQKGGALSEDFPSGIKPGRLADLLAASLELSQAQQAEVLVTTDQGRRLELVSERLREARDLGSLRDKMRGKLRRRLDKQQREAFLREQIRTLQAELDGEGSESKEGDRREELKRKLEAADLPQEAQKVVNRELERLATLPEGHPEAGVARSYLETIADLPWSAHAEVSENLDQIEAKLEEDHHALDDVKRRILEHMAVLKLGGGRKGTVLCLAGPPGVGKTSLGRSIADATGRPFVRIALGGVRDEAELRGHRRTYVGAIPGRIVGAMRKAGVKNPVILLDEVDKLSRSFNGGAPEAALLEILDPEQNSTFTDHYLELEFDLSEVTFICTANDLSNMSAPLRDRLEIIRVAGYTRQEKLHIARKHLLARKLEENALEEGDLTIDDENLALVIDGYTREAGVRQLGRELSKLARAAALRVARADAEGENAAIEVDEAFLRKVLGRARFFEEVAERTAVPGVATGLAWTPVGGDILFIESSRMPGKGRLEMTGKLGEVMQESARAALTYLRSHADELEIDASFLEHDDLHIHVPAGGVPKDGPSAGVAMFSALVSNLTGRRVRADTGMTGEVTLRGRVLPVGGIRAKVLAAHRAGLSRVILPKRNEADLDDLPDSVRDELEFILVDDMRQALVAALEVEGEPEGVPMPVSGAGKGDSDGLGHGSGAAA
jgi:ATP-dependent Lon protease